MKKRTLIVLSFFLLAFNYAYSQSDLSIGLKYGSLVFQNWEFQKGNIELNGHTDGRFFFEAITKKDIGKKYSLGLGVNYLGANEYISFRFSGGAGTNNYTMISLNPSISKEISVIKEKFGVYLGMSLPVTFINTDSFQYIEDASFHSIWVNIKDANGNIQKVPKYDIVVSGDRIVERKSSLYVRPEIGLFYRLSDKVKFTLVHMRGYNPGKPVISRNLDPIIYDHETFRASDIFVGNYRSTNIGIELKIR